jgi:acetoin utilization deacetylase AcuC-like enzyme/nucleotide-binding universal stress UspA family protein
MDCVLCSIDLSPDSMKVVAWAAMLARRMGRPLRIFYAIHQPTDPIHPSTEFERGGGLKKERTTSRKTIERMMQSVKIPWRAFIVYGDPAEMVQQFCRDNEVTMVVAGSKGVKGVKRLFMGTVIERMARMLPCPLLVIRPLDDVSVRIQVISVSCDASEAARSLVHYASDLSAGFNADLQLLHAMGAAMDSSLVEPMDGPYGEVQDRLQEKLKRHLADMVPDHDSRSCVARVYLVNGQAREKFPVMVEELNTDLLMVGVRPRRTLGQWMSGSTTEALLRNAPCHVMVVPERFLLKYCKTLVEDTPTSDMSATGIVRSDLFLAHRSAAEHPESHLRLKGVYRMLDDELGKLPFINLETRAATVDNLTLVHTPAYVRQIEATAHRDYSQLTADTYACRGSYEAARQSAGGVITAIDSVLNGDIRNAFVLNRPPGHHAETSCANGFCLFNNVAVGAAYARVMKGLQNVLVVDWDLHHGNGIQHIFEEDPHVLYISTHQYPCFPGTGHYLEVGRGKGEGYTINLPLGKGWKDGDFAALFQQLVAPVSMAFNPDLILVSAGFDTHKKDSMGKMRVTEVGFAAMTRVLMNVAQVCCRHRMVLVLEGGYHLKALAASVRAVLAELCEQTHTDIEELATKAKKSRVAPVFHRTAHVVGHIWTCLQP